VAHFHIDMAGRAPRFMPEGNPRQRKLMDFRRSAPSGRGRKYRVPGRRLQRDSRALKRELARELRYELRRVARMATAGIEVEPDTRALCPAFAREIV